MLLILENVGSWRCSCGLQGNNECFNAVFLFFYKFIGMQKCFVKTCKKMGEKSDWHCLYFKNKEDPCLILKI